MELLFATGNRHKAEELRAILPNHRITTPEDIGVEFKHEETGKTFGENALGKAVSLHMLTGKVVIADDSGLCVDSLGGAPGIYSARYGSTPEGGILSREEKNVLLLAELENISDRSATFVCAMTLLFSAHRHYTIQEILEGTIVFEPRGIGGFGYDPLFYVEKYAATLAELPDGVKNKISHRGRAASVLSRLM